jgi:hypothetical protein
MLWTELMWLKTGTDGGLSDFIKCLEVVAQLAVS